MVMNILYFNILLIHKIEFTKWNTIYQMQRVQKQLTKTMTIVLAAFKF